jgi:hypothetical protein
LEQKEEFWILPRDIDKFRKIIFPRSIIPREGQFRKPILTVFRDGS